MQTWTLDVRPFWASVLLIYRLHPQKGDFQGPGKVCGGCVRAYRAWYLEVMGLEYLIFGI